MTFKLPFNSPPTILDTLDASNPINKVIYKGQVLIDLTEDTVSETNVTKGVIFHLPSGKKAVGTATATTTGGVEVEGTAVEADVLKGKTFTTATGVHTGTMPIFNDQVVSIDVDEYFTIEKGYHDGNGIIQAKSNIETYGDAVPNNVDKGVSFTSKNGIAQIGTRPIVSYTLDGTTLTITED